MIVNSVSISQNSLQKNKKTDEMSFKGGLKPEIIKNQLKILLTQDIWEPKLKVKMPDSKEEKEVLLEVLKNRAKLDRFTRLSNEKANLKIKLLEIDSLSQEAPASPRLQELKNELLKKGNINSIFQSLNKNINLEIKKNKQAYDYFKNIEKLEDEYIEKRLMKTAKMEKFWQQIKKGNINADGKYSTNELIDIISKDSLQNNLENTNLPKKTLLSRLTEKYEKFLREYVNIYDEDAHHYDDSQKAKQAAIDIFKGAIDKNPGIEKQFRKIYEFVQNKFLYKLNKVSDIPLYPVGDLWKEMKGIERKLIKSMKEAEQLKLRCAKNSNEETLKKA